MATEIYSVGTGESGKAEAFKLAGRAWEADLIDWRGFRIQQTQNWKARLRMVDKLYQGDWASVFPNEATIRQNPHVMNLVQTGMEDIAKLVTEAVPSITCPPTADSDKAALDAHVREAILRTHWQANRGDVYTPRLAMDIVGAGAAFVAAYPDPNSDYPCYHRIDPRFAYPDVANGQLLDLMVLEDLNVRTASRLFPELGLDDDPMIMNSIAEIMHYYSPDECLQAVLFRAAGGQSSQVDRMYVVRKWKPRDKDGKPYLPVAFAQLDSYDGAFRGMFDQIAGSLLTKNRIVKQTLDYADQWIYAPLVEKGVMNPEKIPGPGVVYHLDPTVDGAMIGRVEAAQSGAEVFNLLEYLDREQRGGISYPSARQGQVAQSQASASFVASTQGALTSSVRNVQRLISSLREQLGQISFKIDECMGGDMEKPLLFTIQKRKTYVPTKAISGSYQNVVTYGAAAGLDRTQADIRVMQHHGNGLVSAQTAREQIDYIADPDAEEERIEKEMTRNAAMQKLIQMEDPTVLFDTLALQETGMSFAEAVAAAKQKAAAQQPQAPEGAPTPEGAVPGENAGQQAEALQSGGTAAAQPEVTFAPQPFEQIQVRPPSAGRVTPIPG